MSIYGDYVYAQNERNEKNRHPERNRSVEDILANKRTCPEESIYQIGTIEESVQPEILLLIVNEFYGEFEKRFGKHIRILDWALHLDGGARCPVDVGSAPTGAERRPPHIHERHVFDCENKYGEVCPQQEKEPEYGGLLDDVADTAYKKACETVADTVRKETQKADAEIANVFFSAGIAETEIMRAFRHEGQRAE